MTKTQISNSQISRSQRIQNKGIHGLKHFKSMSQPVSPINHKKSTINSFLTISTLQLTFIKTE